MTLAIRAARFLAFLHLLAFAPACTTIQKEVARPLVDVVIAGGEDKATTAMQEAQESARQNLEALSRVGADGSGDQEQDWRDTLVEEGNGLFTRYYTIRHIPVSELVALLNTPDGSWKSPLGRHVPLSHLNMLVLTDTMEAQEAVARVLERSDRMSTQVLIKAKIFEIRRSDGLEYGLQAALNRTGASSGSLDESYLNLLSPAFQEHLSVSGGKVSDFGGAIMKLTTGDKDALMNMAVHMLVTRGQADILAEPSIVVNSGHEAMINTVREVPIPKLTGLQPGQQPIKTVEYREAGIRLKVRPRVIGSDGVLLEVSPEVSSVAGTTSIGGDVVPIFAKRNATTVVDIADNETLIIGGLQDTRFTSEIRGIPVLSSIPLIGPLFRSKQTREEKTTIFIHLKINILKPGEMVGGVRFSMPKDE